MDVTKKYYVHVILPYTNCGAAVPEYAELINALLCFCCTYETTWSGMSKDCTALK